MRAKIENLSKIEKLDKNIFHVSKNRRFVQNQKILREISHVNKIEDVTKVKYLRKIYHVCTCIRVRIHIHKYIHTYVSKIHRVNNVDHVSEMEDLNKMNNFNKIVDSIKLVSIVKMVNLTVKKTMTKTAAFRSFYFHNMHVYLISHLPCYIRRSQLLMGGKGYLEGISSNRVKEIVRTVQKNCVKRGPRMELGWDREFEKNLYCC
jgi:hypothetical protein